MDKGMFGVLVTFLVARGVNPFTCYGDLCNRGNADQFCSSTFRYCRNCADIVDDCGTKKQPLNCTSFCTDYLATLKLEVKKAANCLHVPKITDGNMNVTNGNWNLANETTPYLQRDVLEITCNPGYRLQFTGLIHCGPFGEFRFNSPTCEAITCNSPPRVLNGNIHMDSASRAYKIGESVSYICDSGYSLHGAKSMTCTEDGVWAASDHSNGYSLLCLKDRANAWMYGFFAVGALFIIFFLLVCMPTIRKRKGKNTTVCAVLINTLCKWDWERTVYESVSAGTRERKRNTSTSSQTDCKQTEARGRYLSHEAAHDKQSVHFDVADEHQAAKPIRKNSDSAQLLTETASPSKKTPEAKDPTSVGVKAVKPSINSGTGSVMPGPVLGNSKSQVLCSEETCKAVQPESAQCVNKCYCNCYKYEPRPRPELPAVLSRP